MVLVATALLACATSPGETTGTGGGGGTDATSSGGSQAGPTTSTGTPASSSVQASSSSAGPGPGGNGQGGDRGDCTEVAPTFLAVDGANSQAGVFIYNGGLDPVLVDAGDGFQLGLYDDGGKTFAGFSTGTFDLTENGDENYATCSRCIRIFADNSGDGQVYFQREGTMVLTSLDAETGVAEFSLDGVVLEEVTIDPATFESTPVAGGACAGIADGEFNPALIEAFCDDFIDNDDNNSLDCADATCQGTAACVAGATPHEGDCEVNTDCDTAAGNDPVCATPDFQQLYTQFGVQFGAIANFCTEWCDFAEDGDDCGGVSDKCFDVGLNEGVCLSRCTDGDNPPCPDPDSFECVTVPDWPQGRGVCLPVNW